MVEARSLQRHHKAITCLQFGVDESTVLSAAEDGSIIVSSIDGKTNVVLSGHRERVLAMAFEPKLNCLMSGAADGSLALWSIPLPESSLLQEQKPIWISREHSKAVLDVAISRNGKYAVTAGADGLLKVWALSMLGTLDDARMSIGQAFTLSGHKGSVLRIVITPDGSGVISISSDGTILSWDLSALEALGNSAGQQPGILVGRTRRPIAVTPVRGRDRFATISAEGLLDVWTIGSGSSTTGKNFNHVASAFLEHELTCLTVTFDGKSYLVGDRVGDVVCFDLFDSH